MKLGIGDEEDAAVEVEKMLRRACDGERIMSVSAEKRERNSR